MDSSVLGLRSHMTVNVFILCRTETGVPFITSSHVSTKAAKKSLRTGQVSLYLKLSSLNKNPILPIPPNPTLEQFLGFCQYFLKCIRQTRSIRFITVLTLSKPKKVVYSVWANRIFENIILRIKTRKLVPTTLLFLIVQQSFLAF